MAEKDEKDRKDKGKSRPPSPEGKSHDRGAHAGKGGVAEGHPQGGGKAKPPREGQPKEKKGGKGEERKPEAKAPKRPPGPPAPPPRLYLQYRDRIVPMLRERLGRENPLSIPRLVKVVVNMGVGKAVENKARVENAAKELARITGRRPVMTRARRSISGFKLRQGMPIGAMVTLRRAVMWEFLDRVVSIILPRIRDFRGLPRRLDGTGNYTIGISEQTVFPEIRIDEVEFVQGMNITLVTTARSDEEALLLLEGLGLPLRKAS
ncbi:MAG TPA: 50S ribosomal protein L5 [Planctomycetota bacterium]|nr:50S ribosomal protein L5 [Planctomycetota bacterium]